MTNTEPRYRYIDFDGFHELTRTEILAQYYKHWSEHMKAVGKDDQITEDACVEDFVIVHWAERMP